MSWWAIIPLTLYLVVGALVALAYLALKMGTRGSGPGLQGGDLLTFPLVTVVWLPYILWVVLKHFVAVVLLPPRWTKRW